MAAQNLSCDYGKVAPLYRHGLYSLSSSPVPAPFLEAYMPCLQALTGIRKSVFVSWSFEFHIPEERFCRKPETSQFLQVGIET